jgi:hypothetical protein
LYHGSGTLFRARWIRSFNSEIESHHLKKRVILVAENTVKLAYFYSVSEPDPDSTRPVDPDSESGYESRRAKMTHKNRKKLKI